MTHVVQQNGGAVQRQTQLNQKLTEEVSKKEPNALPSQDNLYALLDGGVISIPLAIGTILIIVGATGLIINWKDITGNLTELGTIAVDWVTDTASDVTDKIIDKLSQGTGIARGILEKFRQTIEDYLRDTIFSSESQSDEGESKERVDDAIEELLEGATLENDSSKSKIYSKSGGEEEANRDFDELTGKLGATVKDRGGGTRTAELPDRSTTVIRSKSREHVPTIQIDRPGVRRHIKIRYR